MDPQQTPAARLILSTAPDPATATRIAEALVQQRLAACVNIIPALTSIYRWQGAIESASELLLIIKTTTAQTEKALSVLRQLHPYEVPEGLVLPIDAGLPDYLAWIQHSTAKECDSLAASDETH
jgi:periplasmic divalent cation tolerance protein